MSNNAIQSSQHPSHTQVSGTRSPSTAPTGRGLKVKILGAVLAGATLLSATGCGFVQKQTADSWSVTYEVEVQGADINVLEDVSYDEAFSRGEESGTVTKGEVVTTNLATAKNRAKWSTTAMVTAGSQASVTAKPLPGATATCRILLDETRELIAKTGRPGETVTCTVETPAFDKK